MIAEGQIVLFRFPQTNQTIGKLRPARLAVVDNGILLGKLGEIDIKRLSRIKQKSPSGYKAAHSKHKP